jgi:hypothetical protein
VTAETVSPDASAVTGPLPSVVRTSPTLTWVRGVPGVHDHVRVARPPTGSTTVDVPGASNRFWATLATVRVGSEAVVVAVGTRSRRSGWAVPGPINSKTEASPSWVRSNWTANVVGLGVEAMASRHPLSTARGSSRFPRRRYPASSAAKPA